MINRTNLDVVLHQSMRYIAILEENRDAGDVSIVLSSQDNKYVKF